jgi:hypothetical protein
MVPPLERAPEARGLIEQDQYFVVHAPRQSGKTTFLRALAKDLMASGEVSASSAAGSCSSTAAPPAPPKKSAP